MKRNKYRIVDENRIVHKDIEGQSEARKSLQKIAEALAVNNRRWNVKEQRRDSFEVESVSGIKHTYSIEKQESNNE
jgi:hypothetical protein